MPTLNIARGQSIHFFIRSEVGTINAGAPPADNDEYFPGTTCGVFYSDYSQLFDCADSVDVQIEWDNTDPIIYHIIDQEDDSVDAFGIPLVVSGDYYEFTADWSALDCDTCFKIALYSLDLKGQLYSEGDSGTFETGPVGTWGLTSGLTNTITQDAARFRTGANSARVTAAGVPGAGAYSILSPTGNQVLAVNTWYRHRAYIRHDSANPFVAGGEQIYFAIQSGFGDATIIQETKWTEGDGNDAFFEISVLFRTGSTTTGIWEIRSTNVPQANGEVNIDDVTLYTGSEVEEAISNEISIDNITSDQCIKKVEYENDTDGEIIYSLGFTNFFYEKCVFHKQRFIDPEFTTDRDSGGTITAISSDVEKVITVMIDKAPAYMHEKWARASKSDTFKIASADYTAFNNDLTGDWEDKVGTATLQLEVSPKDFQMTNSNCT